MPNGPLRRSLCIWAAGKLQGLPGTEAFIKELRLPNRVAKSSESGSTPMSLEVDSTELNNIASPFSDLPPSKDATRGSWASLRTEQGRPRPLRVRAWRARTDGVRQPHEPGAQGDLSFASRLLPCGRLERIVFCIWGFGMTSLSLSIKNFRLRA